MRNPQAISNQNDYCRRQNHVHRGNVQCLWYRTELISMV